MQDIIKDTLLDSLKILPFLFLAFLIIEVIEHKLTAKNKKVIERSGRMGPLFGSALGIIPQCGFSVLATNLYVTRLISLGTLIAIYLSTSDEMLPILISKKAPFHVICSILLIKFVIGVICGFVIDYLYNLKNKTQKKKSKNAIYQICHDDHCHCERENLFWSSLKHTLKTLLFLTVVSFIINIVMEYLGNDFISNIFMKNSFISPFISSLIGLIPNCAASIVMTELYLDGVISFASVVSGLLTGSGVAILVLFKTNKNIKENLLIVGLIYFIGAFSGIIIELLSLL